VSGAPPLDRIGARRAAASKAKGLLFGLLEGQHGAVLAEREARFGVDKKGEKIVEHKGVVDKRLDDCEEEFARFLKLAGRGAAF
jgi:hypothetical protein